MKIKKLFKNEYAVGVVCSVLSLIVGILYSSLIARYLGPELKGETAYISSIMGIAAVVLSFGLHQVYPFYRKDDANIKYKFMNNMYLLFVIYSIITAVLCFVFRQNGVLVSVMILSVIAAYMRIVGYIYMVENSVKRNILMLIVHTIQIGYVICLMIFTEENLFWGVSNLIFVDTLLCLIYTVKLNVKPDLSMVDLKFLAKSFALGAVPMVTILSSILSTRIDILMLKEYPNVSMAQIGIYSIGVMLAERVLLVPNAVKDILVSKLAKGKTGEEVAMVMRICFLMFLGITLLGDVFINLVYGAKYDGAYAVTVVTMFGVCAVMFHRMIELYNIVNHMQKFTLFIVVTSTLVNVAVNMFLIPMWGILGAAVATTISYTYATVVCLIFFSRHSGIKIRKMIFITKSDIKIIKSLFVKKKKSDL